MRRPTPPTRSAADTRTRSDGPAIRGALFVERLALGCRDLRRRERVRDRSGEALATATARSLRAGERRLGRGRRCGRSGRRLRRGQIRRCSRVPPTLLRRVRPPTLLRRVRPRRCCGGRHEPAGRGDRGRSRTGCGHSPTRRRSGSDLALAPGGTRREPDRGVAAPWCRRRSPVHRRPTHVPRPRLRLLQSRSPLRLHSPEGRRRRRQSVPAPSCR